MNQFRVSSLSEWTVHLETTWNGTEPLIRTRNGRTIIFGLSCWSNNKTADACIGCVVFVSLVYKLLCTLINHSSLTLSQCFTTKDQHGNLHVWDLTVPWVMLQATEGFDEGIQYDLLQIPNPLNA